MEGSYTRWVVISENGKPRPGFLARWVITAFGLWVASELISGIVIEGFGRYATISGFEGNRKQSDTNNVSASFDGKYLTHERLVWTDEWLTRVSVGPKPPSGDDIRNIRDYKIDFSGFTIRIGLKIGLF